MKIEMNENVIEINDEQRMEIETNENFKRHKICYFKNKKPQFIELK